MTASAQTKLSEGGKAFNSKFAPNLDQFKASTEGFSLSDKLKFMYDQGFRALEDNGMKWRPIEEQNEIAKTMEQLGMEMGVFCAMLGYGNMGMTGFRMDRSSMNRDKQAVRDWIKKEMEGAIEVGKRVNAKWATVVTCEEDDTLEPEYQMANVIECMKYAAEIAERHPVDMADAVFRRHRGAFPLLRLDMKTPSRALRGEFEKGQPHADRPRRPRRREGIRDPRERVFVHAAPVIGDPDLHSVLIKIRRQADSDELCARGKGIFRDVENVECEFSHPLSPCILRECPRPLRA